MLYGPGRPAPDGAAPAYESERYVRPILPALAFISIGLMFAPVIGQQRVPVTIALVPSVPSGSTFIAAEKGYFRDAGLDVRIERIDSLSKAVAFVATNQVQVGQGGINAGYFNAVAEGLPIVMALESGSTPLYHQIILRPELKDKIKTVADLKGRKVGISSPGSTSVYEIGMVLAAAGLRIKDIDLKYLAFTQMGAALANGALDAALEVAPFTDIAIEQKIAVPWIDPEEGYIKRLPLTNVAYIANVEWIKQSPDVAKRLFLALAHGGRDYCQAYHHGPNRAEVVDIMVKSRIVADRDLLDRMDWQARSPDGEFSLDSVDSVQTFFKQEAIIDKTAPRERLVDASFAQAAAKELGPFELVNKSSKLLGCR
jgi:NitT/TauT family transport system substrate-binding protein